MSFRTAIEHNTEKRLFEWGMAFAMLCLAVEIFMYPLTLAERSFQYLALVVNIENVGLLFLVVALARGVALIVNGRSDIYGPRVRAIAALAGAMIWAQMFVALLVYFAATNNPPSPGIPLYLALTGCELTSCYRAATDVRNRRV